MRSGIDIPSCQFDRNRATISGNQVLCASPEGIFLSSPPQPCTLILPLSFYSRELAPVNTELGLAELCASPLRIDIALGSFGSNLNPACIRASVLSKQEMQRRERENILKALGQSKGKIYGPEGAAAILGIKPTTLASRMKKFKVAAAKRTGA